MKRDEEESKQSESKQGKREFLRWVDQKRAWEQIFNLKDFRDTDALKRLIEQWDHFKELTLEFALNDSKLRRDDKSMLEANEFLAKAADFFKVKAENMPHGLPSQKNIIQKLKTATSALTSAPSELSLAIFKEDFPSILDEVSNKFEQERRLRLERDAEAYALHKVSDDTFFVLVESDILVPLLAEGERLGDKDDRVGFIKKTIEETKAAIKAAEADYKKNFIDHKGPNFPDSDIKTTCINTVVAAVQTNLVENKSLSERQNWVTRFGKTILNAILAIQLITPAGREKWANNTLFYGSRPKFSAQFKEDIMKQANGIKLKSQQKS